MKDLSGRILKYGLVLLVILFVLFSLYDGLFKGKDDYSMTMNAGHRYFEDGEYEKAIREFESILQKDATTSPALFGVAIARMQLGHFDEALEKFTAAINLEKNSTNQAFYFANRGILYDRMGLHHKALDDYKMALAQAPETADGPGILSRILHNQPEPPPTIADRARYLQAELAKPEGERILSVPEVDRQQRTETVR